MSWFGGSALVAAEATDSHIESIEAIGGRRHLCATRPKLPDRDAKFLGLVGKIFLYAGAWENHDPDR